MKLVVIFFIIFVFDSFSFAEDMDISFIYRCDDMYCGEGGGSRPNVEGLRDRVGVIIPPASVSAPRLPRTRLISNTAPGPQRLIEGGGTPNPTAGAGAVSGTGEQSGQQENVRGSSVNGQGTAAGMGASGGGSNFNSPTVPGGGTSPNVKGGLLYADDEPAKISAGQGVAGATPALQAAAQPKIDPVSQNRNNSADPASGGSGVAASGLAPSALSLLNGDSGGGARSGGAPAGESFLSRLAKAVGADQFFSGPKGDSGGSSLMGKSGGLNTAQQGKALPAAQALMDPKDILRANYDKYQRGLASQLEFGSSQSFLFQNMCQHYLTYAQRNRIPKNDSPCPRN